VEGLSRPLRLTLTGTCVGIPATRDVYHVTTSVRQREIKTLPVPNHTTSVTYNLRPVVDGTEHFSGAETMVVPPSSTRNYELTYQPLTMTTDGKKHMVHVALNFLRVFYTWVHCTLFYGATLYTFSLLVIASAWRFKTLQKIWNCLLQCYSGNFHK